MKKYYNIEFMRFIFATLIVYYHITHSAIMGYVGDNEIYLNMQAYSSFASIIVEYFLIISGFFLYLSVERKKNKTFIEFLFDKIVRLWPVFAFYTLIMVIFFNSNLQESIFDLFFLRATAISLNYIGIIWYIGPFFYCTLFLFAILKYTSKQVSMITISIMCYISYAISLNIFKGKLGREIIFSFISSAMLRVLGGLCVGIITAALIEEYKIRFGCASGREKVFFKILISIAEIILLLSLFNLFIYKKTEVKNVFIVVIMFSVLLICQVSDYGILSNFFNKPFWGSLGRYAYSIYVMQQISFYILQRTFWQRKEFIANNEILTVIFSIMICIFIGVITYHLVEQPAVKMYERWKNNRKANLSNN